MLSHALLLAEAANPVTKLAGDFGVSVPYILGQIVSFSVVAFVLWQFGFKPVQATIDERQKKIADGLRYSEEMQAKLQAAQQESAAILKAAQVKATEAVEEARKAAKDYLEKQTQEATAKANEIATKAQQAIELEHKKMLADARVEIARLVVNTTRQVLAKELSEADKARYSEAAARELTQV